MHDPKKFAYFCKVRFAESKKRGVPLPKQIRKKSNKENLEMQIRKK